MKFGPSSILCWTSDSGPPHRTLRKNRAMKIFNFVAIGIAGLLATVVVAAQGQTNTTAPSKAEAIVDVNGNLHVPDSYRTIYQFLGSWAVAANQGAGSKELHVHRPEPSLPIVRTDVSLTAR